MPKDGTSDLENVSCVKKQTVSSPTLDSHHNALNCVIWRQSVSCTWNGLWV